MMAKVTYERPAVRTLSGQQLVESLGPVSCGSGECPSHDVESVTGPVGRKFGGNGRMW